MKKRRMLVPKLKLILILSAVQGRANCEPTQAARMGVQL